MREPVNIINDLVSDNDSPPPTIGAALEEIDQEIDIVHSLGGELLARRRRNRRRANEKNGRKNSAEDIALIRERLRSHLEIAAQQVNDLRSHLDSNSRSDEIERPSRHATALSWLRRYDHRITRWRRIYQNLASNHS